MVRSVGTVWVVVAALLVGAPGALAVPDPLRNAQWGNDAIGADAATAVNDGRGALVAVVDSGVDGSAPDLRGAVERGVDVVDADKDPDDENGHGTHVAGIIAARTGNGIGIAGVAPGARVLAIRVLDERNRGTLDHVVAGIDAAVAAHADVITLSLNPDPSLLPTLLPDTNIVRALEHAAASGAVVVAAAGNDALPFCDQPPTSLKILCVAAVDRSLARSSYSNYGTRVDLVAPGTDILSTVPGGYEMDSGTSEAVPFVAGVAAQLVAAGLHGDAVIARLLATARDLGPRGADFTFGHGLLDDAAAVAGLPALTSGSATAVFGVRVASRARAGRVARRGLAVRCRVASRERCSVEGFASDGAVLLKGSRVLRAGRSTTLHVPLTRLGHARLRRTHALRVTLRISAPSAGAVRRTVTITR